MNRKIPLRGRGAVGNVPCRFDAATREFLDDGWEPADAPEIPATSVTAERARNIITRNRSPDIPFEQSINPYRGCEHGCIYCYARPSHAYLGLSPGLDFESRLWVKPDAARLLEKELARPGYRCSPIALGTNTDPYQPIEREWKITRQILEVLLRFRHPVTITTKSSLIERDLDLLTEMARDTLVHIYLSIPTLDPSLARRLEPRATAPRRRLETIGKLASAGIPVAVMVAPLIPWITDSELERIVALAAERGARSAAYVLLRLPLEVKTLFREWLDAHFPLKAEHTLRLVEAAHGGRIYDSQFWLRQTGTGSYAELLGKRFRLAMKRHALSPTLGELSTGRFHRRQPHQLELF
jgi:DNA repair photolyase